MIAFARDARQFRLAGNAGLFVDEILEVLCSSAAGVPSACVTDPAASLFASAFAASTASLADARSWRQIGQSEETLRSQGTTHCHRLQHRAYFR